MTGQDEITLSTGVVLRTKGINPILVDDAIAHVPIPEAPWKWVAETERDELDETSSAYQLALQAYHKKTGEVALNIMMAFGLDIVSTPPELPRFDDPAWVTDLASLG